MSDDYDLTDDSIIQLDDVAGQHRCPSCGRMVNVGAHSCRDPHQLTLTAVMPEVPALPSDEFTIADRDFCRELAKDFRRHRTDSVSAEGWEILSWKIEKVLVGEYISFSHLDAKLIQALHLQVLRTPLVAGAKARSRALTRLGTLVAWAERGMLAQQRGAR